MKIQRAFCAALLLWIIGIASVSAQSMPAVILSGGCGTGKANTGSLSYLTVDTTLKLCVNATVSASISPFTPGTSGARGTQLAVTTSDSSGSLPTNGGAVVVTNTGSNPIFCNVNGNVATTSDQEIAPSGGWFNFGIPTSQTALHCIATGGSSTANSLGGSGLATGTGGGSGGGSSSNASVSATGSAVPASATYFGMLVAGNLIGVPGTANGLKVDGSAVTQPVSVASAAAVDCWSVTDGCKADPPATLPITGTTAATEVALLKAIANAANAPAQLAINTTPTDCSSTIATGGTAQAAIAAQTTLHGFTIANIDTGHNDEVMWISFTGTASAGAAGSYPLPPPTATTYAAFGSYTTPPGFGSNHAVSIIGATTSHAFSCTWW